MNCLLKCEILGGLRFEIAYAGNNTPALPFTFFNCDRPVTTSGEYASCIVLVNVITKSTVPGSNYYFLDLLAPVQFLSLTGASSRGVKLVIQ